MKRVLQNWKAGLQKSHELSNKKGYVFCLNIICYHVEETKWAVEKQHTRYIENKKQVRTNSFLLQRAEEEGQVKSQSSGKKQRLEKMSKF